MFPFDRTKSYDIKKQWQAAGAGEVAAPRAIGELDHTHTLEHLAPHLDGSHFGDWYYFRADGVLRLVLPKNWASFDERCAQMRDGGGDCSGCRPYSLYEVCLLECVNAREALDWIAQVSSKMWCSSEVLGDLVRMLDTLLRFQGSYVHCDDGHTVDVRSLLAAKGRDADEAARGTDFDPNLA